jgi:formylglycine-generating enzyme required for sulfatase activity
MLNTAIDSTQQPVQKSGSSSRDQPVLPQQTPSKKHSTPIFITAGIVIAVLIVAGICLYTGQTGQTSGKMVYIPAGWFWMGCSPNNNECNSDEKPYHKVYLDAYYIDRNDVTVDEYTRCVNAGVCAAAAYNNCRDTSHGWVIRQVGEAFKKGDHPQVCVNWYQAREYCRWKGGDLPTEAQWEKAARGTGCIFYSRFYGRIYPWGNYWDASKGCFNQPSTCAVGSYPQGASPYGVLDMAGNVFNWCRDWYDENYYANSPDHNPTGPGSGIYLIPQRVRRGSSWRSNVALMYVGVSERGMGFVVSSDWAVNDIGFRCVR